MFMLVMSKPLTSLDLFSEIVFYFTYNSNPFIDQARETVYGLTTYMDQSIYERLTISVLA